MNSSLPPESQDAVFQISDSGYIRHWLAVGPKQTLYIGPPGSDQVLRREALDYSQAIPPSSARLHAEGPFGLPWRFHDPGRNEFVEFSDFYHQLTVVEYFAWTEIVVPEAETRSARFWVAGAGDLWVNGEHVVRLNVTRYRNPDSRSVELSLQLGSNRLCVRLQCLGVRDTRILFGLCLNQPGEVTVQLKGAAKILKASEWIDGVKTLGPAALVSQVPAPFQAKVISSEGTSVDWHAGSSLVSFSGAAPVAMTVETQVDAVVLQRMLETPSNRRLPHPPKSDRKTAQLEFVAKAGIGQEAPANWNGLLLPLFARRLLGRAVSGDGDILVGAVAMVDGRKDCADFVLAALLRMELLGLCAAAESAEIKRAALAFRYWQDEPGNDAMCFWSENHSLLFHGCQLLAGRMFPEEQFGNSGLTGKEQEALALPRIWQWLEKIESRGFEEFNSSTYMPITVGAMLNVVDFCGDRALAARMSGLIDMIFRGLALHSFGGGVISPQGRVYRDVLFPEDAGTQVLVAWATEGTDVDLSGPRPPRERSGDWVVFPASSPGYRPPADLADLVREPAAKIYRQAEFQIVVEKTPAYLLTSLAVPAVPRDGESPDNDLRPGGAGYQQHLWQATLGRDCHVFVNHPGGFFDGTKSRPGYWYGNGLLPRVWQKGPCLAAIYVIADGSKTKPEITPDVWEWGSASTVRPYDLHPIPFTHAYWPADSFDREERVGGWVFGQKDQGLIGLWCSENLVPHDDILRGRELRANSYVSAWLVVCGDLEKDGSLENFMRDCQSRAPEFDADHLTMGMKGEDLLRWWERSEPAPG